MCISNLSNKKLQLTLPFNFYFLQGKQILHNTTFISLQKLKRHLGWQYEMPMHFSNSLRGKLAFACHFDQSTRSKHAVVANALKETSQVPATVIHSNANLQHAYPCTSSHPYLLLYFTIAKQFRVKSMHHTHISLAFESTLYLWLHSWVPPDVVPCPKIKMSDAT